MQRRENGYFGRRMLEMQLPRKRQRRRSKKRCMDPVKGDIEAFVEEDSEKEDDSLRGPLNTD